MPAAEQVAQQFDHKLVGFAFNDLKPLIELLYFFNFLHAAKLFDHGQNRVGGLLQHSHLLCKIHPAQVLRSNNEMLGELLSRFGDFVEGSRQRFDVFALQPRDECIHQLLADLFGDALLLSAGQHKVLQSRRAA